MKKNYFSYLLFVLIGFLLISCGYKAPLARPDFKPVNLDARLGPGEYRPKVDNFIVILDASGTKQDTHNGATNLSIAKDFLTRMNMTIPNLKLQSALRTFGFSWWPLAKKTTLHYGFSNHTQQGFQSALDQINRGGGNSPADLALDAAGNDLATAGGRTAVILVGDGQYSRFDPVGAAKRIKARFGDSLCIYTVLVGRERPDRVKVMQEIAAVSNCGFYQSANNLESPQAMADWVTNVFLEKAPMLAAAPQDRDGDGVIDSMDKCPDTPRGVAVDKVGCPLDTDGDGVYDYKDKCPGTPAGAKVNDLGCWILGGVLFDTAKWTIKPQAYPELGEIVAVLKKNPALKVEIQGHTDNRGSKTMNQTLSEKRANAVMEYLVKMGIQPQRLSAAGYGFARPIASNGTANGRALNRRVELKPSR